jgi:hypothetical protein
MKYPKRGEDLFKIAPETYANVMTKDAAESAKISLI